MIRLINESKHAIILSVNGADAGTILVHQTKELDADAPQVQITLKHTYPSYAKADTAHLSVEVTYTIEATKEISLRVHREKIRFDLNGYYDALLLHDDDLILGREYRVSNVQKVRKKLRRYKILYSLFVDPIEDVILGPIVELGCLGALLYYAVIIFVGTYFHVWKYILLALVALLLIDGLLFLIFDVSIKHLFNKLVAKETTALSELDKWTNADALSEYYRQTERKSFCKEVHH